MVCFPHDPKCTPKNDGEKPEKGQGRPDGRAEIRQANGAEEGKQRHRQPCNGEAPDQTSIFHSTPTPARILLILLRCVMPM